MSRSSHPAEQFRDIAEPLVENPDDAIRVWIHEDAVTVDEGRTYSAWLPYHGHIFRRELAGRDGTPVAGVFLRCSKSRPIWMRPRRSAWLRGRRRLEINPRPFLIGQVARIPLGLLLDLGHSAARRWGPHP